MKCPRCKAENPEDQEFCGKCGAKLVSVAAAATKSLETERGELRTGSVFAGRYRIVEELGKGGMGKVYRAVDKKLNEEVALKLIKPEIASDKKTIKRFSNELRLSRKISHRNVGRMYELMEEGGTHFITMEYVPGEDLKSFIRRSRRLDIGTAISIAKQVCEGLFEAHRLGVIHRDLKPNNIMIDKGGNARIMDFGIARTLTGKSMTRAGAMIGTPEYMSPEQAEAEEVDHRSDIYSLGVILYEMATGRLPFEGETALSVAMKHKGEIPKDPKELNPQIPADLSQLILKCMEKEKENRYQEAGELLTELNNIEQGIPTTDRVVPRKKLTTSKEITVTLNLKRVLIPVVVIAAVVIIGLILWQIPSEDEASLAPKIENSILVSSFENQTGDESYNYLQKAIPNLLITSLEQTGFMYVATWERMHDLLGQIGQEDMEIINSDLGFKLCQVEGIEAIVLGSFTKGENIFATDIKVFDTETKRLLKSASSTGEGVESILMTQIDELSKEISQGIGISKQTLEATQKRITDYTTTSIEAYNNFASGREEEDKIYWEDAQIHYEKAVELDPEFASAYHHLGNIYNQFGNIKARNAAYEKAMSFMEKATEKERLYIEANYAKTIERDPEKQFRFLNQLTDKYPKEKKAHYNLAMYYYGKRMFNQAIKEFNMALELDPDYAYAINSFAILYIEMENYEEAIRYFQKYITLWPEDANPLDSMGWIYFLMGRIDEAITKFKEALTIKPNFHFSNWSLAYIYTLQENHNEAMKLIDQFITLTPTSGMKAEGYLWRGFYHYLLGRMEQSLIDFQRAENLWMELENDSKIAGVAFLKGWIYCDLEKYDLSRESFKSWFDFNLVYNPTLIPDTKSRYSFYIGYVDLKQGRINSAKSQLAELKSLLPKIGPANKDRAVFNFDLLRGEVYIAEGAIDEAISIGKEASSLGKPPLIQIIKTYNLPFLKDVLARAYQQKGELDKSIAEYERLVNFDPSTKERCLIHPKYHYRLAKLYEQKEYKGKAIEHYEKFLKLWENADPINPEIADAQVRLAALKGEVVQELLQKLKLDEYYDK